MATVTKPIEAHIFPHSTKPLIPFPYFPTPNNFPLPNFSFPIPFMPRCLVGWINRCVCVTLFPGGSVEEGRSIYLGVGQGTGSL